jgi:CheY-like chemotaxis protein
MPPARPLKGELRQRSAAEARAIDVMIVEDDDDARSILHDTLLHHGFTVLTARDRSEGIDLLAEGARPRAILMDLMMAGADMEHFQSSLEDLIHTPPPFVAMSVASEDESPTPPGAVARLDKPIEIPALIALVRRYVS